MMKQISLKRWVSLGVLGGLVSSLSAQVVLHNETSITIQSGLNVYVQGDVANSGSGVIDNNGVLEIQGNISNNSSTNLTTGNGEVSLAGGSQQVIDGSSMSRFHDLALDNAAGLQLGQGILVEGNLDMLNGNADLNGQDIDLGMTGSISNETNTSRILGSSGKVTTTRDIGVANGSNIAGIGVAITSSANLGMTTIDREHSSLAVGSGFSIERSFDIRPANNNALAAMVRIYFFGGELLGQNGPSLTQWRLSPGAMNWTPGLVTGSTTGYIDGGPYNSMGLWTLSAEGTSSIDDLRPELPISYFPNPLYSGQSLILAGLPTGNFECALFDVRGKKVLGKELTVFAPELELELTLPELALGMYTIQLLSKDYQPMLGKLLIH